MSLCRIPVSLYESNDLNLQKRYSQKCCFGFYAFDFEMKAS